MSRIAWIAKLVVSVALVGWLVRSVSFAPVIDRLGEIKVIEVVLVIVLVLVQYLLFGLRWWLVGRTCVATIPLSAAIRIALIGVFFNQTLPATIGGDVMRVYLSRAEGVRTGRAVAGVLIDRIAGMVALVGLVTATLPAFYGMVADPIMRASLTVVALAVVTGFGALLLVGQQFARFLDAWRFGRPFGSLTADLRGLFTRPVVIPVTTLSIAIHLLSVALVILLASFMGVELDAFAAIVLVPPVILVMMIPISLAGWGVRESALVVALAQTGVAAADALAISIAFGLVCLAASIPGGVLWLLRSKPLPRQDDLTFEEARYPSS